MVKGQLGVNAQATFNGLAISSASNTLTDVVPGVTLTLSQIGSSDIAVVQDKDALQTKIQKFADAYSALSKTLADSTKYVAGGTSGALQGDSTTVGIQSLLRNTLFAVSGSGTGAKRLSDVGLELQKDGTLKLNATKLTTAMADMTGLQTLFTQAGTGQTDNGFALKFKTFAHGLLNASSTSSVESVGALLDKKKAIQSSIDRNSADQDRVTARAAVVEAALRKQYSALDTQMATLTSLGSYVTAQLAQWNKTTS
jgi:flagellar hook-associated protein 2